MLADTAFIIDIMRNEAGAVRKAKDLSEASVPILVGTPTIFELYIGVGLSLRPDEERERVLSTIRSLLTCPLTGSPHPKPG